MNQKRNTYALVTVLLIIAALLFINKITQPKTISSPEPTPDTNQSLNTVKETAMDVNELIIEDIATGSGEAVKSGDTVTIDYTGTLLDGTKFDSSIDRGTPFTTQIGVGQVIQGWDEGVVGMQVGGKRKLTIPSSMGYGPNGIPGVIPGGAALVFEVELISIN